MNTMGQVTLKLDDESIAAAKEANIDLSELLVHALRRILPNLHAQDREEAARQWYEENKEAVDAYNKLIEEHGLFYESLPKRRHKRRRS
jgi:post-segregation antitoxin (ccd killing protein)